MQVVVTIETETAHRKAGGTKRNHCLLIIQWESQNSGKTNLRSRVIAFQFEERKKNNIYINQQPTTNEWTEHIETHYTQWIFKQAIAKSLI